MQGRPLTQPAADTTADMPSMGMTPGGSRDRLKSRHQPREGRAPLERIAPDHAGSGASTLVTSSPWPTRTMTASTPDEPAAGALPMDEATRDAHEIAWPSIRADRAARSRTRRAPGLTGRGGTCRGRHARASRSSCPPRSARSRPTHPRRRTPRACPSRASRSPATGTRRGCTTCTFDIDPPPSGNSVPRQRPGASIATRPPSATLRRRCPPSATLDPERGPAAACRRPADLRDGPARAPSPLGRRARRSRPSRPRR